MTVHLYPLTFILTDCEQESIHCLKQLLGDFNSECAIYSDTALLCYIYFAIDDINAHPTVTCYDCENWPPNWRALLLQGAQVQAIAAQALFEKAKEYEINDNGIVLSPPAVSELLNTQHAALLTNYEEKKERIKANVKPGPFMLGHASFFGFGVTRLLMERHKRFGRLW